MCSFLVQIVYGCVCFAAMAMTLSAMFTPEWSTYTFPGGLVDDLNQGIEPYSCGLSDDDLKMGTIFKWKNCREWFDGLPWTNALVIAMMSIGLGFQILAFVWNIFTIFACCCKKYVIHALPVFSILASIFLCIGIAFYAIYDNEYLQLKEPFDKIQVDMYLGYSFWLSCGAAGLNFINLFVASAAICCTKRHI